MKSAAALGVSVCTLRRWERAGYLLPAFRLRAATGAMTLPISRPSFASRKKEEHLLAEVIGDLGNGINYKKRA